MPHAATSLTTDPLSQGIVAAVIVGLFVLLALEKAHRVLVALAAVAVLWGITYLTPYDLVTLESAQASLDLNVLLLLAAMMAIVGVLKTTGVFGWAVTRLLAHANGRPHVVVRLVSWFTGLVSSVADNVTTVIFVTPMALRAARPLGVRPVVFLLPMVMAANIGGTATLIGDPPNIMIGSGAGLTFVDFVVALALPCVLMLVLLERYAEHVFGTELAAGESAAAALGATQGATGITAGAATSAEEASITDPELLRWALGISALVFVGFFTHGLTGMPAAIPAMIGAAALLVVQDVLYLRRHRPTEGERVHGLIAVIEREIEWPTLIFFAFLFIAVGAAVGTGLIGTAASGLAWAVHEGAAALGLGTQGTLLFAALLVLWVSGGLSAIIDNIPFVAVTIPIIAGLRTELAGDTMVLWWALSLGACLGGNGTAVGASANVTTIGLAERAGSHISFGEFTRFGAPVTVITLLVSTGYLACYVFLGRASALVACAVVLVPAALLGRRRSPQRVVHRV
ncbi:MAG TPA: SLC13 family permease [Gemmatimonadaceae bacterium]|nr:SLC13 family permease [Gemmatimonadaceae bacterium]